ncbi:unnamed protein product, partial [Iphiclides podalirius]
MPCSGTLGVVPKRMGWLWTAQDQSGVKVLNGWKPGAISKRLLKKLNEAKRSKSVVEEMKQTKRTKKRYGHKPTLIISKKDGEYRIQMQAMAEGNDATTERYSPVIYRIAKADNEDRKRKKDRITRRLARRAVKDILPDSYDPKACNNVCLEAYKQAVGLPNSYDEPSNLHENNQDILLDSCSCSENDVSSSCTSSEIDWEIQFTPPKYCST